MGNAYIKNIAFLGINLFPHLFIHVFFFFHIQCHICKSPGWHWETVSATVSFGSQMASYKCGNKCMCIYRNKYGHKWIYKYMQRCINAQVQKKSICLLPSPFYSLFSATFLFINIFTKSLLGPHIQRRVLLWKNTCDI